MHPIEQRIVALTEKVDTKFQRLGMLLQAQNGLIFMLMGLTIDITWISWVFAIIGVIVWASALCRAGLDISKRDLR